MKNLAKMGRLYCKTVAAASLILAWLHIFLATRCLDFVAQCTFCWQLDVWTWLHILLATKRQLASPA